MRCQCKYCRRERRNPDERVRVLERTYLQSPSLATGTPYLRELLRTGASPDAITPLYEELREAYPAPYTDLAIESVLIGAHFYIGGTSNELCGEERQIECDFSKALIWDYMRDYPPGTSQAWIDEISATLYERELVSKIPVWYDDRRSPRRVAGSSYLPSSGGFNDQEEPHYAVALFHPHEETARYDGFLRVIWNNVYVPDILEDCQSYHGSFQQYKVRFDYFVEDEPMIRDYEGPRIASGNIPGRASGGRRSISTTHTQRVNLNIGADQAVDIVTQLARCIYFADSVEEEHQCSGLMTYTGDLLP